MQKEQGGWEKGATFDLERSRNSYERRESHAKTMPLMQRNALQGNLPDMSHFCLSCKLIETSTPNIQDSQVREKVSSFPAKRNMPQGRS